MGRYQVARTNEQMARSFSRHKVFPSGCRNVFGLICASISIGTTLNVCAQAPPSSMSLCDGLRIVKAKNHEHATPIKLLGWGSGLTFTITAAPTHGTLGGTAPDLNYTPTPGYVGSDSFKFTRTNGAPASETVELMITVENPAAAAPDDSAAAPDDSSDIPDDAKKKLQAEWREPTHLQNVLNTFQLLVTAPPPDRLDCKVLVELAGRDPNADPAHVCINAQTRSERQDVYRAALGNPGDDDHHGEPDINTKIDFLDDLAKANGLGLKAPLDEKRLFACTDMLIQRIYSPPDHFAPPTQPSGKIALGKVDQLFNAGESYAAMYRLLEAFPKDDPGYIEYLEDLRAAFEMDTDNTVKALPAQVAKRTTGSKSQ